MQAGRASTALWLVVVFGYAAVAGLARPFTVPADVAAGVAGVAVLTVAAFAPSADHDRPAPVGVRWWALLAAALVALELAEYAGSPRAAHPTLSSLAGPALAHWPGRSLAFAAWLLLGRALARR